MKFPLSTIGGLQMAIVACEGYLLALEDLEKDVDHLAGQFNVNEEYWQGAASALQSVRERIQETRGQTQRTLDTLREIKKGHL